VNFYEFYIILENASWLVRDECERKAIAEIFDALENQPIDIRKLNKANGALFRHDFEEGGNHYWVEMAYDLLDKEWKRKVVLKDAPVRKGDIGGYSVSLYGPNLQHPTGISDMAETIKIYNRMMLVINKVLADKTEPEAEVISFISTTEKMARIYVHLFKRLLPEWVKISNGLYVKKSALVLDSRNK
jgi:hypothetical protein